MKDQIKLFFLPSYSSELSPDEFLSFDLKSSIRRVKPLREMADEENALYVLRFLQKKQPGGFVDVFKKKIFSMPLHKINGIKMPS